MEEGADPVDLDLDPGGQLAAGPLEEDRGLGAKHMR
jgi:hypothetical protein